MAVDEGEPKPAPRPRGRPRSDVCHQAILSAAMDLLEQGKYADVTMEGIAQRAGVAKQTLYKWWPSKAQLLMEAYAARAAIRIAAPDTGQVEEDLRRLLWHTCCALTRGNLGPALAGLIAEAQSNPELQAELRETLIMVRRQIGASILQRGIERGELRRDLPIQHVLDLMYGPIWYRLLLGHAPLDEAFARGIVDHLLPGLRAPG